MRLDHFGQPFRPGLADLRDVDILGRKSEIARQHEGGAAVDRQYPAAYPAAIAAAPISSNAASNCSRSNSAAIGLSPARVSSTPRPSPRISSTKPGKLVAMNAASSTCTGFSLRGAQHQRRHGDAVIHVGLDQAAAGRRGRWPCTIRSSPSISTSTPLTRSRAAVASSRSDSLTRSSLRPRMRVVPSANAAATARIGYSSIMVGARSGGTSTPFSARAAHPQVGDLLAALVAPLQHLDRRAHLPQRRQQAGAQRVEHDAVEHDLGARHDQRRDQRKRGRRRVGRHHDRRRHELRLADRA